MICDLLHTQKKTINIFLQRQKLILNRASVSNNSHVHNITNKTYGWHAFNICAPFLWNKLPLEIENQKA